MGAVCIERLAKLVQGPLGEIAIETGTCKGQGAASLARFFPKVLTIELSESLFELARERLAPHSNVQCLLGSSPEKIAEILSPLDAPVFFFLDAHWSGDHTVEWSGSKWKGYGHDTAHLARNGAPSGPEQCPLARELESIMAFCKGPASILVDDVKNIGLRDAGFPGEDWTHLSREKLLSIVEPRLESFLELEKPAQWFLRLRRS